MTREKLTQIGLTAAFLLLLCAPGAAMLVGQDAPGTSFENRRRTQFPEAAQALTEPTAYARTLEAWFADSFGLRPELIRFNNRWRLELLRDSPKRDVLLGRTDPWLFYADEGVVEDYENLLPFPRDALRNLARILEERRLWLERRGIKFLVAVAPNKHTVYEEFLPRRLAKVRAESRLDQLARELRENTGVELLDLRAPLLAAKKDRRTYCHTDTHWNDFGGFVGSREIVNRLRADYPSMRPLSLEDYRVTVERQPGGDLAALLSLPDVLTEEAVLVTPKNGFLAKTATRDYPNPVDNPDRPMIILETGDRSLPRALVLRDSYAGRIAPYLSERLRSAVYIWTHDFLPEIIEREKPDVVIMECVERYLYQLGRENPESVRAEIAGQALAGGKAAPGM